MIGLVGTYYNFSYSKKKLYAPFAAVVKPVNPSNANPPRAAFGLFGVKEAVLD